MAAESLFYPCASLPCPTRGASACVCGARRAQGKLTAAGLKQRLGAFYKNLPSKEIKLLLGDGTFTKESLRSLLADNQLGAYDPMAEAFKAYDPNGTGFIDTETLRSIFESLGYGEIDSDDLNVLVRRARACPPASPHRVRGRPLRRHSAERGRTGPPPPLAAPR